MKLLTPVALTILMACGNTGSTLNRQVQLSGSTIPPAFAYQNSQAVFVDFESADYTLVYDQGLKSAKVRSVIRFRQETDGYPLFDYGGRIFSAKLNGVPTATTEVSLPQNTTRMRTLSESNVRGLHTLELETELTENLQYESKGVRSAFWMNDLADRRLLEQYLPANLEYDQVSMTLEVQFMNSSRSQEVLSNGKIDRLDEQSVRITFPDYFNSSSIYFHTFPSGSFSIERGSYISTDGRSIPLQVYSARRERARRGMTESLQILKELESDYGPWPHPSVIVYIAGVGGMEHSGATITELKYLGHELFHSYHARGLMPAGGDSGWMDEAIAMWRDNGYQLRGAPGYSGVRLSGRSPYLRYTPVTAYDQGEWFIRYLAFQLGNEPAVMKGFLRSYFETHKYRTVTTELFRSELERFSAKSFSVDFDTYVYGTAGGVPSEVWGFIRLEKKSSSMRNHPIHPVLSREELLELL